MIYITILKVKSWNEIMQQSDPQRLFYLQQWSTILCEGQPPTDPLTKYNPILAAQLVKQRDSLSQSCSLEAA